MELLRTFDDWRRDVDIELARRGWNIYQLADLLKYRRGYLYNVLGFWQASQVLVDEVSDLLGINTYVYTKDDRAVIREKRGEVW